jgi:hypothetical protein
VPREPHYLRQFFAYDHLPPELQAVSQGFGELAGEMDETLPENPEKTAALRFLLQAKDCAVRARLFKGETPPLRKPADTPLREPPPSDPIRKG